MEFLKKLLTLLIDLKRKAQQDNLILTPEAIREELRKEINQEITRTQETLKNIDRTSPTGQKQFATVSKELAGLFNLDADLEKQTQENPTTDDISSSALLNAIEQTLLDTIGIKLLESLNSLDLLGLDLGIVPNPLLDKENNISVQGPHDSHDDTAEEPFSSLYSEEEKKALEILISGPIENIDQITNILSTQGSITRIFENIDFNTPEGRNIISNLTLFYEIAMEDIHSGDLVVFNDFVLHGNLETLRSRLPNRGKHIDKKLILGHIQRAYDNKDFLPKLTTEERLIKDFLEEQFKNGVPDFINLRQALKQQHRITLIKGEFDAIVKEYENLSKRDYLSKELNSIAGKNVSDATIQEKLLSLAKYHDQLQKYLDYIIGSYISIESIRSLIAGDKGLSETSDLLKKLLYNPDPNLCEEEIVEELRRNFNVVTGYFGLDHNPEFAKKVLIEWFKLTEGGKFTLSDIAKKRKNNGLSPDKDKKNDRTQLTLQTPTTGWERVQQLLNHGIGGVELEKALQQVARDAGLGSPIGENLQTTIDDLQQQSKNPDYIFEAIKNDFVEILDPRRRFYTFESQPFNPLQESIRSEDQYPLKVQQTGMDVHKPGIQRDEQDSKQQVIVEFIPGAVWLPLNPEILYLPDHQYFEVIQPKRINDIAPVPAEFIPTIPEDTFPHRFPGSLADLSVLIARLDLGLATRDLVRIPGDLDYKNSENSLRSRVAKATLTSGFHPEQGYLSSRENVMVGTKTSNKHFITVQNASHPIVQSQTALLTPPQSKVNSSSWSSMKAPPVVKETPLVSNNIFIGAQNNTNGASNHYQSRFSSPKVDVRTLYNNTYKGPSIDKFSHTQETSNLPSKTPTQSAPRNIVWRIKGSMLHSGGPELVAGVFVYMVAQSAGATYQNSQDLSLIGAGGTSTVIVWAKSLHAIDVPVLSTMKQAISVTTSDALTKTTHAGSRIFQATVQGGRIFLTTAATAEIGMIACVAIPAILVTDVLVNAPTKNASTVSEYLHLYKNGVMNLDQILSATYPDVYRFNQGLEKDSPLKKMMLIPDPCEIPKLTPQTELSFNNGFGDVVLVAFNTEKGLQVHSLKRPLLHLQPNPIMANLTTSTSKQRNINISVSQNQLMLVKEK